MSEFKKTFKIVPGVQLPKRGAPDESKCYQALVIYNDQNSGQSTEIGSFSSVGFCFEGSQKFCVLNRKEGGCIDVPSSAIFLNVNQDHDFLDLQIGKCNKDNFTSCIGDKLDLKECNKDNASSCSNVKIAYFFRDLQNYKIIPADGAITKNEITTLGNFNFARERVNSKDNPTFFIGVDQKKVTPSHVSNRAAIFRCNDYDAVTDTCEKIGPKIGYLVYQYCSIDKDGALNFYDAYSGMEYKVKDPYITITKEIGSNEYTCYFSTLDPGSGKFIRLSSDSSGKDMLTLNINMSNINMDMSFLKGLEYDEKISLLIGKSKEVTEGIHELKDQKNLLTILPEHDKKIENLITTSEELTKKVTSIDRKLFDQGDVLNTLKDLEDLKTQAEGFKQETYTAKTGAQDAKQELENMVTNVKSLSGYHDNVKYVLNNREEIKRIRPAVETIGNKEIKDRVYWAVDHKDQITEIAPHAQAVSSAKNNVQWVVDNEANIKNIRPDAEKIIDAERAINSINRGNIVEEVHNHIANLVESKLKIDHNFKQSIKGDSGPRGIQGLKGDRGEKGDSGPQGEKGEIGPVGPQGPKGKQGSIGDKGDSGPVGSQGPAGPPGANTQQVANELVTNKATELGKAVIDADLRDSNRPLLTPVMYWTKKLLMEDQEFKTDVKGETGPEGPQGPKGKQGPIGETGKDGASGPIGPQGPEGKQGPKGEIGPIGPQGQRGEKGDKGEIGAVGPQGPEGKRGQRGEVGKDGASGPRGIQGLKGDRGEKGDSGPQGEKGEIGPEGPQGLQGEPGKDGTPGPPGEQGPRGWPGQDTDPAKIAEELVTNRSGKFNEVVRSEVADRVTTWGASGQLLNHLTHNEAVEMAQNKINAVPSYKFFEHLFDRANFNGTTIESIVNQIFQSRVVEVINRLKQNTRFKQEIRGPKGEDGTPGLSGPAGRDGVDGAQGPRGIQGETGAVGPEGPQGPKGKRGSVGKKGDPGQDAGFSAVAHKLAHNSRFKRSLRGDDGSEGPRGEQGPAGQDGVDGAQGSRGEQGKPGPRGRDGKQGKKGDQGEKGEDGAQGLEGPQGPRGEKGENGVPGLPGEQGPAGQDGTDGAQGPRGRDGKQGKKGDQGERGEGGAQGPEGPRGEKGEDGAQSLLENLGEDGVDSFTPGSGLKRSIRELQRKPQLKIVPGESYDEDKKEANIELEVEGKGGVIATFLEIGYFFKNDNLYIRDHITGNNVLILKDFHFLKVVEDGLDNYKLAFCNNLGNLFFDYKKYDQEYAGLPEKHKLIDLKYIKNAANIDLSKYYYHTHTPLFTIKQGELEGQSLENHTADVYEIERNKKIGTLIDEFCFYERDTLHCVDYHQGLEGHYPQELDVKIEKYEGEIQINSDTIYPIMLDDGHFDLLDYLGYQNKFM